MATTKHINKSVTDKSVDAKFTGKEDRELLKSWEDSQPLPGLSAAPSGEIPRPKPSEKPSKTEESE